ncbi:unnamed protein product [Rangifer tarandus platyrhynchus]|uniref:Uncharacterized protein n=1 Tax=Rangifer tarandus platyrhynchus TaxID=3082113 RepID=A0AC59YAD4_RANTA
MLAAERALREGSELGPHAPALPPIAWGGGRRGGPLPPEPLLPHMQGDQVDDKSVQRSPGSGHTFTRNHGAQRREAPRERLRGRHSVTSGDAISSLSYPTAVLPGAVTLFDKNASSLKSGCICLLSRFPGARGAQEELRE